jgi:hypothetical protein
MTAGLPVAGLAALLFVVLAVGMPLNELLRTLRGRSSRRRWAAVTRLSGTAVAMVVALAGTWAILGAGSAGGTLRVAGPVPATVAGPLLWALLVVAVVVTLVAGRPASRPLSGTPLLAAEPSVPAVRFRGSGRARRTAPLPVHRTPTHGVGHQPVERHRPNDWPRPHAGVETAVPSRRRL